MLETLIPPHWVHSGQTVNQLLPLGSLAPRIPPSPGLLCVFSFLRAWRLAAPGWRPWSLAQQRVSIQNISMWSMRATLLARVSAGDRCQARACPSRDFSCGGSWQSLVSRCLWIYHFHLFLYTVFFCVYVSVFF